MLESWNVERKKLTWIFLAAKRLGTNGLTDGILRLLKLLKD